MSVRDTIAGLREQLLRRVRYGSARATGAFRSEPAAAPPGGDGPVARLYTAHRGRRTHKWTHFAALYDRHLPSHPSRHFRMLEIGISTGGSLEIWRRHFGPDAIIAGLDLDPATAANVDAPTRAYIGHQADQALLARIAADCGPFDLIIDDGSHVGRDQLTTLQALWPHLADGGLFVIEDTMTSYLPGFYRGGYGRAGTALAVTQQLTDDLHDWAHGRPARIGLADLAAVHVYPTIVFLEKCAGPEPRHTIYGGQSG